MKYRVLVSASGRHEWRQIDADSADSAMRIAAVGGARVQRVDAVGAPATQARAKVSLTIFLQETLTLLQAGLTVVETIETLERKERDAGFKRVLGDILRALREGAPLSAALVRQSDLFPAVLIAGVAASETSGGLSDTLQRYLAYDEKIAAIRRKVVAAAIYPSLLLVVGGGVILFLVSYVLPKFSAILDGSGRNVAGSTAILMRLGEAIHAHPMAAIGVGFSVAVCIAWLIASRDGRALGLALAAKLPMVSGIAATLGLSRLYRTLSLLLDSGIPLPRALDMICGVVHVRQAHELRRAISRISAGQSLTEALSDTGLTPPIAESLLRVGERSGALASMSDRLADFFDQDLDRKVDTFTRLFEPLLMAIIGMIIGAVVLAMYSPIFDLVGSVGQ